MLQGTKEKIPNTTSLGPLPIRRAKAQMFQARRRGTEATPLAPWLGTQESSLYLQERDRQKDGERQREGGRYEQYKVTDKELLLRIENLFCIP